MLKKMYQKLESFWGITGKPVLTFFITMVVLLASVSASVLACSFLERKMNPTYFDVIKGQLPTKVILQNEDSELYLANLEKEMLTPLNMKSQYLTLADTGEVYGVTFHSKNIQIDTLTFDKKGKEVLRETYSISYQVCDSKQVEVKVDNNTFYVLDKVMNELVYFTLANRVNLTKISLDTIPTEWVVEEQILYYYDDNALYWHDLRHGAKGKIYESEGINGLLISGDELVFSEKGNEMGFVTTYNLTDKEISNSRAVGMTDIRVIPSQLGISHFYLYLINSLGGITLEMVSEDLEETYSFDNKNAIESVESLNFINGYGYFINEKKQGVIVLSDEKSVQLGENIKNLVPLK